MEGTNCRRAKFSKTCQSNCEIWDGYAELPWPQNDLVGDICEALCTLAPENIAPLAIPVLLDIFNAAGQDNAQRLQQKEAELRQANANNPDQPPDQVIKMAAAMNNVGLMGMFNIVRALLHFAFQRQTVEDPRALTATQRTVLTAIVINDAAWTFSGNMLNLLGPLFLSQDRRRLLNMRDFLRQLLQHEAS
jgi:hypothetical protein